MNDWRNGGTIGTGTYWSLNLDDHADDCNGGDECRCEIETISAFEDTQDGFSQWYAWKGTYDDHDRAEQTGLYPTRDEAVAALDA